MTTATDVDGRIREVMGGILEVDPASVDEGFLRDSAPSWDSLNHLRLVSALEEAFGIRFTMREVGELDGFDAIRRRIAGRA
jgi:acyl carrier protein